MAYHKWLFYAAFVVPPLPSSRQSFHHTHRWYIYDAAQLTLPDIDSLEVWPLGLTEAAFDRRAARVSARERAFAGSSARETRLVTRTGRAPKLAGT